MQRVLDRDRAVLVVVDVQEAFRDAIPDFDLVTKNSATLIQGFQRLDVPVIVTEQYPRGLGVTVREVTEVLKGSKPLDKVIFSAAGASGFNLDGRDQALLCGIETHVCVNQTAHDLLDQDVEVHVATDAVASRTALNKEIGLQKMLQSGAILTSVEAALFELLKNAEAEEFKSIQKLIL